MFSNKFITPERELDKISGAECVLVFHGVKYGHSYRSQECTVDLIRTIFESSSFAKSMSCDKTKARAIACSVLGPYFTTIIINNLLKTRFYSWSVDASNKGSCKTFSSTVQYFSEIGVCRSKRFSSFEILLFCERVLNLVKKFDTLFSYVFLY